MKSTMRTINNKYKICFIKKLLVTTPLYISFLDNDMKIKFILKSATKPLKVLIAFTRPLITEFADNLNLKHPLLPTISPYPTM